MEVYQGARLFQAQNEYLGLATLRNNRNTRPQTNSSSQSTRKACIGTASLNEPRQCAPRRHLFDWFGPLPCHKPHNRSEEGDPRHQLPTPVSVTICDYQHCVFMKICRGSCSGVASIVATCAALWHLRAA